MEDESPLSDLPVYGLETPLRPPSFGLKTRRDSAFRQDASPVVGSLTPVLPTQSVFAFVNISPDLRLPEPETLPTRVTDSAPGLPRSLAGAILSSPVPVRRGIDSEGVSRAMTSARAARLANAESPSAAFVRCVSSVSRRKSLY